MHMIPTRSTSLALLFAVLVAGAAYAQASTPQTGTGENAVDWPRTFTGQPDFAFTREEVLKDARARPQTGKDTSSVRMPTLNEVATDETRLDPLGLAALGSSTTVSSSAVSSSQPAMTLMEKLLANSTALPTYTVSYTVDMNEFRTTLQQTIRSTVNSWKPDRSRYSYAGLISGLTLQAVVTSPEKYAIINGQRYAEGDTFQLKAPLSVPDTEITAALEKKMPVSGTVPENAYDQYQTAYEETISSFAAEREKNPDIGRQTLSLPVTVVSIVPRKVKLNVNGEEHELGIKFTY